MTAPAQVVFLDTETTGLHPDLHQIWEVALITQNGDEHVWQFPIAEIEADPFALNIGHYWERHWSVDNPEVSRLDAIFDAHTPKSRRKHYPDQGRAVDRGLDWCRHFRDLTAGCHLAGAVVSFDEERLRRLLWSHGVLPRWHYHLVDVEGLAAGFVAGLSREREQPVKVLIESAGPDGEDESFLRPVSPEPPWDSEELSRSVGVDPGDFERHSALGDARWAKAIYEAVMGS